MALPGLARQTEERVDPSTEVIKVDDGSGILPDLCLKSTNLENHFLTDM